MQSMLVAVALAAGASIALGQNSWDIWGYWNDEEHFLYAITELPDFDQRRDPNGDLGLVGLPNGGRMYCAPTSATDIVAWIANHGHSGLDPGPERWQDYTLRNWGPEAMERYQTITWTIGEMGDADHMATVPDGGTGVEALHRGISNYLRDNEPSIGAAYAVQTTGVDGGSWNDPGITIPDTATAAFQGLFGAVMTMRWGHYDTAASSDGSPHDLIGRSGGHIVAVQRIERVGPDTFITVSNPYAVDETFTQSDFGSQRYRVEWVTLDSPSGGLTTREVLMGVNRTFEDIVGGSVKMIDEFTFITPRRAFSVNDHADAWVMHHLEPDGAGSFSVVSEEFPLPFGDRVVALSPSHDQRYLALLAADDVNGSAELLRHDLASGAWETVIGLEVPNDAAYTHKRTIVAAEDSKIWHLNPYDTADPVLALAYTIGPPGAVRVDDDREQLVVFYPSYQMLEKYSLPDMALQDVVQLPWSHDFASATDFQVSPPDGTYWFVVGGVPLHVMHDLTVHEYTLGGVAESLSLDEYGGLLVVFDDRQGRSVWQYEEVLGQELVPADTSPFNGLAVGPGFSVVRSRLNVDRGFYDQPGSADLDVDTIRDTFAPSDPPDPRELCGISEGFEGLGADGEPVPARVLGGVTVTMSTGSGEPLSARTYGSGQAAFIGVEGGLNAPFTPSSVSGSRFVSTSDGVGGGELDDVAPIVFTMSEPVRAFGLTTLDLLEYPVADYEISLRGYDAQGSMVAEHVRAGNQGASGTVLHWLVESSSAEIVEVRLAGVHPGDGDFGIDDLSICPRVGGGVVLEPVVVASIHDEPRDGSGDSFNSMAGLIREQSTREDRAVLEYDLAGLEGQQVVRATVSGRVYVNNAVDNGERSFDFSVYEGNGQADLSDFEIVSVWIGSGAYHPPADTQFEFSFDATAPVRSMVDGGAGFVGLRADCTSDPNFPNVLDASTTLTVEVGYCPADFNQDGSVNTIDVLAFLNAWAAGDASADFNGDGRVNTIDVLAFLNAWAAGC